MLRNFPAVINRIRRRNAARLNLALALLAAAVLLGAHATAAGTERAPTLRATPGDRQATLSWTAPPETTAVTWQYSQDYGVTWTDMRGSSARTATYTVRGLINDMPYAFQVRALNGAGAGAASNAATVTPTAAKGASGARGAAPASNGATTASTGLPPTSFGKPKDFKVITGDRRVFLEWTNTETFLWHQYSKDNGATWIDIPDSDAWTTRHEVRDLVSTRTYTFRVRGVARLLPGDPSDPVTVAVLDRPTYVQGTPGDGEVTLTWRIGGLYAWYEYEQDGVWHQVPGSHPWSPLRHTIKGLTNGRAYTFRVRGSALLVRGMASVPVVVAPGPPGKPRLTATAGNGEVKLTWTPPAGSLIESWEYWRSFDTNRRVPGSNGSTRTYTVTGLTNGTTYRFQVRGRNRIAGGNGTWSDYVSATPALPPGKPTGLGASSGDATAYLGWTAPSGAVTRYDYRYKASSGKWSDWKSTGDARTVHTVSGLTNYVAHAFQVRAVNHTAVGPPSGVTTILIGLPPKAPTNLTATAGDEEVALSWTAPAGRPVIGYWYTQDGLRKVIPKSSGTTTTYTVTGLTNGTKYTFQVLAGNRVGLGAMSNSAAATPAPSAAPGAPVLSAEAGDTRVTLTWTAATTGGSVASWDYSKNDGSTWTAVPGSDGSTRTYTVESLTNDTEYTFKVRAKNSVGNTASNSANATPQTPTAVPGAPTLSAAAGDTQVTLTWTKPSGPVTSWEYQQDGGSWTAVPGSGSATRTYTVKSLTNRTRYAFKVRGKNSAGDGAASNEARATPKAPPPPPLPDAPTNLTATAGNGQVRLTWTAPASGAVCCYRYCQKTHSGVACQPEDWIFTTPNQQTYMVQGLTNGVTYYFRVQTTIDPQGNFRAGPPSNQASATPLASGAPGAPTLSAEAGNAQVKLTWTKPSGTITSWEYSNNNGELDTWTAVPGSGATTTTYTVPSLNNGTEYTFRVRAKNGSEPGAASNAVKATPKAPAAPGAPTNLTASPGNAQVTLTWTKPSGPITGWHYSKDDGSTWTAVPGSDSTTTTYTVPSLTNGTEYTFKVRAKNNVGNGTVSNSATATPFGSPGAPTNLTASPGNAQATLSWTKPSGPITGWDYSKDDGSTWTAVPGSSSTTTTYTVPSLTNGTEYTFKVRAKNVRGAGAASNSATATPFGPPSAPTNLTASAGNARATLRWTKPSGSIDSWDYSKDNGSTWTAVPGSSAATTTYTAPSLTNGTEYTFKVRAVNKSGNGAASNSATATPFGPPGAPTLTASAGDGQVKLTWTAPSGPIDGWEYEQYAGSAETPNWKAIPGSGATTTTYTVMNLTNDTKYTFEVRAKNSMGAGAASNSVDATPRAATTAPAAPVLSATGGDGQVKLTWTLATGTVASWEYQQDSGSWTAVPGSHADTRTYTVPSLTNDTQYAFRVRGKNSKGNGAASNSVNATPTAATAPPAAPTNLKATAGDARVKLTWTAPADGAAIASWEYVRSTDLDDSGWKAVPNSGAATRTYTVPNLTNGIEYAFKVRAKNSAGTGPASNEARATPRRDPKSQLVPDAATNLKAAAGDKKVKLTWTAPTAGGFIDSWEYLQFAGKQETASWKAVPGSSATTTTYTVPNLTNGTVHTFKVRAKNSVGNGPPSNEASATPFGAPGAPNLSATAGNAQVKLEWTTPSGPIDSWEYLQFAGKQETASWTAVPGSDSTTTAYMVPSLTNGTQYAFRVRAVNGSGNGVASNMASATPGAPKAPAAPTNLTATAGNGQARLLWTAPSGPITSWEYQQDGGTWTAVPSSNATTTTYTVPSLTNGTEYAFKVRAVNSVGNGTASNEARATPTAPPGAPTLTAATPGDTQVTLTWTAPSGAITIWDYSQDNGSTWTAVPNSDADTTTYTVPGLTNDTAYTFKVRAKNSAGDGAASNARSATPTAATQAPGAPTLTAEAGNSEVTLTWTAPSGDIISWDYSQDDGSTWTAVPNSDADTTTYTVQSLTNGTKYTFKVRAKNSAGNGAASNSASATPAASLDDQAPTLAAASGDSEVTLTWQTPSPPEPPADEGGAAAASGASTASTWSMTWEYQQDNGEWTLVPGSHRNTRTFRVTGLTNGTKYAFKVRGKLRTGQREDAYPPSNSASATPDAAPGAPTLTAATPGNRQVSLTWTAPSGTITSWEYQKGDGWAPVPGSDAATTTYTVPNLTNGKEYTFQVRAKNSKGAGTPSNKKNATPMAPPPTLAAAAGNARVTLTWTMSSAGSITGWEYQQDGGTWAPIEGSNSATRSYTVPDLDNDTAYAFKVRAMDNSIAGTASNEARATPRRVDEVRNAPGSPSLVEPSPGAPVPFDEIDNGDDDGDDGDGNDDGNDDDGGDGDGDEGDAGENRPPQVVNEIADQEVTVGKTKTVDVSDAFMDPDGEALTYTATSSNPEVVTVSVSGGVVTITGLAGGSAEITVTVSDGRGGTASITFTVTINRPPQVAAPLADQTVLADTAEDVDVADTFVDPDDDPLTYTAASSNPAVVVVSVSGSMVTMTGAASGSAEITVVADDGRGGTASDTFTVTVNRPPRVAAPLADQTVPADTSRDVDVSGAFVDPDGDPLTYAAASSNSAVVTASVSGDIVTVIGVAEGAAAVTVVADDGKGGTASDSFTVTVVRSLAHVNRVILPEVARTLADQTVGAIARRVEQAAGGAARVATLGGQSTLDGMLNAHGQALADHHLTLKELLADSDFALSLKAANAPGANRPGLSSLSVWGNGDYRRLADASGALDWDGEARSVHLGADVRPYRNLLTGVALSWGKGDVDYDDAGIRGRYELGLAGVHPYLGWSLGRLTLWGTAGYGRGSLEIADEQAGEVSSDVAMYTLGMGGSGDLLPPGANALRLKTEVMQARLDAQGGAGLGSLGVEVSRLRLSLEASRAWALSGGGRVQPLLEVGLRHDGGDGRTGSAAEIIGGLHYASSAGLTFEGRVRTSLGRSGDDEWGVQGLVRWGRPDHRGLSVSVMPGYGVPDGDVQSLWRPQELVEGAGVPGVDPGARVRAAVGYGFEAPGGVVTPYSELTLNESGRSHRVGMRWLHDSQFELELEGERREQIGASDGHAIMLRGRVRY